MSPKFKIKVITVIKKSQNSVSCLHATLSASVDQQAAAENTKNNLFDFCEQCSFLKYGTLEPILTKILSFTAILSHYLAVTGLITSSQQTILMTLMQ